MEENIRNNPTKFYWGRRRTFAIRLRNNDWAYFATTWNSLSSLGKSSAGKLKAGVLITNREQRGLKCV